MILLIAGSSHTGKTLAAQRVLEKYSYPYLSIDHLKMGLIRSGICPLTPESSDEELTPYLWNIVREIIKTAIENNQNLTVEGCYIPFGWERDFALPYKKQIRFVCLIFSEKYIREHFEDIKRYSGIIERRIDDGYCTEEMLLKENRINLEQCRKYGYDYILIDEEYRVDIVL